MITILEKFLTELEMGGGGGKSDYKDCFRSQKEKKEERERKKDRKTEEGR